MLNPQEKTTLDIQPSIISRNKMQKRIGNQRQKTKLEFEAKNEIGVAT